MYNRLQLTLISATLMCASPFAVGAAPGQPTAQTEPGLIGVSPLPPEKTEFMQLEQIKPGMKVVAYTVFQGSKVEPFTGTVQGIAWNYNFLGPQRHVVIVRFDGERLQHDGIVHGMSGSPVYIDGKLVGAVSLALSPFPKDPIAGVTPIEYMVDEGRDDGAGPGTPQGDALIPTRLGWAAPGEGGGGGTDIKTATSSSPSESSTRARARALPDGAANASGTALPDSRSGDWGAQPGSSRSGGWGAQPGSTRSGDWGAQPGSTRSTGDSSSYFRPLLAPLTFSGLDAGVFEHYRSAFGAYPVDVQLAGGGGGALRELTREQVTAAAASLGPGSPVAGVLVEGDVSLSAVGTVTYRDKDQIYAFGHPFLEQGPVAIPMASADVIATVADQTYPYKLANRGALVGTVVRDRGTAIVGEVGAVPQMLPMRVSIRREGVPSTEFSYRLAEHKELTPVLVQIMLANSLKKQWRYSEEGTYFVRARIRIKDGQEINTRDTYSMTSTPGGNSLYDVVKRISEPFTALYQNPFHPVLLQGVDIQIDASPQGRMFNIEDVYVDRTEIRPGENVDVKIAVQLLRGDRQIRTVKVPIPPGLNGGDLVLKVADADTLEKTGIVGGRQNPGQARDIDQLVSILNRSRSGDRCYIQLLRKAPGVVLQHQQLTTLPESVRNVLQKTASSEVVGGLDRTVVWEGELSFDGALVGNQELSLAVLPPL